MVPEAPHAQEGFRELNIKSIVVVMEETSILRCVHGER